MQKVLWRSWAVFLAMAGVALAADSQVKVVGERVNLRSAPAINAEVVGQLNYGELLELKSSKGEWLEVVPPTNVDVWIHKEFINDGVVMAKKLQVRSGPGINFHVIGYLNRGDHVVARGDFGDWLKIVPPLGSSVWLNNKYAEVLNATPTPTPPAPALASLPAAESVAQTPEGAPAEGLVLADADATTNGAPEVVTVTETPVVAVTPTPEPLPSDFPDKWKLIPLEGQGKRIEIVGVLRRVGFFIGRPCPFQLKRYYPNGSSVTLCYVWANEEQLSSFLGQQISVGGREYWVEGSKYPVIIVERILPVAPSP